MAINQFSVNTHFELSRIMLNHISTKNTKGTKKKPFCLASCYFVTFVDQEKPLLFHPQYGRCSLAEYVGVVHLLRMGRQDCELAGSYRLGHI